MKCINRLLLVSLLVSSTIVWCNTETDEQAISWPLDSELVRKTTITLSILSGGVAYYSVSKNLSILWWAISSVFLCLSMRDAMQDEFDHFVDNPFSFYLSDKRNYDLWYLLGVTHLALTAFYKLYPMYFPQIAAAPVTPAGAGS
jgi:hypothetical protein